MAASEVGDLGEEREGDMHAGTPAEGVSVLWEVLDWDRVVPARLRCIGRWGSQRTLLSCNSRTEKYKHAHNFPIF